MKNSSSSTSSICDEKASRLSELPEEVIHDILSLLPIEEAVRSCVLSRSWEHLWKSMPRLNFDIRLTQQPRERMITLVDRVCRLHNTCYQIQSFKMWVRDFGDDNALVINSLLNDIPAITTGQELCLTVNNICQVQQPFILPSSVFTSKNLVRLQLCAHSVYITKKGKLVLPESIYLPRLKFLQLTGLEIITDLTSVETLFSSPLLERLIIHECRFSTGHDCAITIRNPNLKQLDIFCWFNPNVNYHDNDLHPPPPLRLSNCVSLKELHYQGNLMHEFHITDDDGHPMKPRLDRVVLRLGPLSVATHGLKLLNSLSTTNKLNLCSRSCYVIDTLGIEGLLGLARFDNLTELIFSGFNASGVLTEKMLTNSPCLQSLRLKGQRNELPQHVLVEPMPLCIQTKLKKIEIVSDGSKFDDFIAKLFKNAQVLEEVVLYLELLWEEKQEGEHQMVQMLRNLPRVSENVKISIVEHYS